jgi:hypothetical protein
LYTAVIIDSDDGSAVLITQLRTLTGVTVEADAPDSSGMSWPGSIGRRCSSSSLPLDEALAAAERLNWRTLRRRSS